MGCDVAKDQGKIARPVVLVAHRGNLDLGAYAEVAFQFRPQGAHDAMLLDQAQDHPQAGSPAGEPDLRTSADDRALHAGLNDIDEGVIGEFDDALAIKDDKSFRQAPDESLQRKWRFLPIRNLAGNSASARVDIWNR